MRINLKNLNLFLLLALSGLAFGQDSSTVEIVVTGKQPGPPLWKISKGENTLWIFAYLSPIPEGITWESKRVEDVIADAEVYIPRPDADIKISKGVMLNPLNLVRGWRLAKKLNKNPDGESLVEIIPADLYQRFSNLKQSYFPRNKAVEAMRPVSASRIMTQSIEKKSGLESGRKIIKKINRLVRRNDELVTMPVETEIKLEGNYKTLKNRIENLAASLPLESEIACMERQVSLMEEDIDEIRYRANAWARGYVDEFRYIPIPGDSDDDCTNLILLSSEKELFEEVIEGLRSQWLETAKRALDNNKTSFAVLDINLLMLSEKNNVLNWFKENGYEVYEP